MNWRYIGISILLFFLSTLWSGISKHAMSQLKSQESVSTTFCDAEHTLAIGKRIPFNCIDLYSLGLIPALPESVRESLVNQKQQILNTLSRGSSFHEALQRVRGIGAKTAHLLARYITDGRASACPQPLEPPPHTSP